MRERWPIDIDEISSMDRLEVAEKGLGEKELVVIRRTSASCCMVIV